MAGEKNDPWSNAMSSAAFCVWLTLFACCMIVFVFFLFSTSIQGLVSSSLLGCGMLACHRLSCFVRVPCSTVLLLCVIVTSVLVNVAVHCASQSWPTDNSDVFPRSGNMCAVRASTGKFGKSNSAVCVAVIVSLFGKSTLIPCSVFCLLVYSAETDKKWPVHPVSTMRLWLVVEGPNGGALLLMLLFTLAALL